MDIIDIKAWIKSLKGKYDKRAITGVAYCENLSSYMFYLKNMTLWFSVHNKYPYVDLVETEHRCNRHLLSNHLKDMVLSGFKIENNDVVIKLTLTHKYLPSQTKFIFFEMQRYKTNLILTDKHLRILYVHREIEDKRYGRSLWMGSIYTLPPTEGTYSIDDISLNLDKKSIIRGVSKERREYFSDKEIYQLWHTLEGGGKLEVLDGYLHITTPNNHNIIGEFYEHYITLLEMEHQKSILRERERKIVREKKRLTKLIHKLEEELKTTEDYEKYKLYGDAVLTFMKKPSPNGTFTFTDWKTGKQITIPVESGKNPSEVATYFYKKYKHLKKKRENLQRRIADIKKKIENLDYLTGENDKSTTYSFSNGKPFWKLEDEFGNIYLVGKNKLGNHIISFHLSSKKHLWFHVKNFPGSHVILKPKNGNVTEYAIITAAKLAAYFSKLRNSSKVEVIYTLKKNIKPVKGELGLAIYQGEKSIIVTPESPEEMEMQRLS